MWSLFGPVPPDGVGPRFRDQSNLSFMLCLNPQSSSSKLHKKAAFMKYVIYENEIYGVCVTKEHENKKKA